MVIALASEDVYDVYDNIIMRSWPRRYGCAKQGIYSWKGDIQEYKFANIC